MKRVLSALILAVLLAGCQGPRPLYYWGNYEGITYLAYVKPDKATPAVQVEKLQEDVQRAAGTNAMVNPGLHAHLGYLYTQMGQSDLARKEFEREKELFPESAAFIDRLLNQEKKP